MLSPAQRRTLLLAPALALFPRLAAAEPGGPALVCEVLPDAPSCAVGLPACTLCHTSTDATMPTWNAYGDALVESLDGAPFDTLPNALAAIAEEDADGDGFSNEEELLRGTLPGDAASAPAVAMCPEDDASDVLLYQICSYDARFAYRRVWLDFCGHQPSFEDYEAFGALDPGAQRDAIHDTLETCLQTPFWRGRDGMVWQLAYPKVRPVHALKAGLDPSPLAQLRMADYDQDLALFAYTQLDDHDARDVVLADYFVDFDGTSYTAVDDIPPDSGLACTEDEECPAGESCYQNTCGCFAGCRQGVVTERRQGLLTTRWTALYSTMFSAMPRNTAAQAYRSFLGFDIAKQEGLFPAGTPADYDNKGVDEETCAVCHSTLDPLSYPFSTYQGFGPFRAMYYPGRMQDDFFAHEGPNIGDTPEAGVLMGQPVADLGEWAQVAAESDAFARTAVLQYWELLLGGPPTPDQTETFANLWQDFASQHDYRVRAMLHDLIDTEAYGAP
ncbi:MAG: hypothetical protein AAGA54_18075 [Myxococcota bacterium]